MIAKLTGLVDQTGADWAIVDVGGVGYLVFAASRTLARLPPPGQPASLLVETHVREDHIHLYGFADAASRDWFRLLITVQGVGARVALAVQSALDADELLRAVASKDKASLTRASGVGPKLAGRIVAELKDKVGALSLAAGIAAADGAVAAPAGPLADAISALVNLGYRRVEAFGAVARVTQRLGPDAPLDAVIRGGLQELAR